VIPIDCEICLREEVVPVACGERVTVSDHFALRVDLDISTLNSPMLSPEVDFVPNSKNISLLGS
jgi:hypothetical protein